MTRSARTQVVVSIVTGALALVFAGAGVTKLLGLPWQVELFHSFGLPHWMLLVVGAVEIVLAGLLISKTTRSFGAIGLAMLMIGASLAHVMTHVLLPMLFVNAALCFAAGWLVMQHRPEFFRVRSAH